MKHLEACSYWLLKLVLLSLASSLVSISAGTIPLENLPWGQTLTLTNTKTSQTRTLTLGAEPTPKTKKSTGATASAPETDYEVRWTISGEDLESPQEYHDRVTTLFPTPVLRKSGYDFDPRTSIDGLSALLLIGRMAFEYELANVNPATYQSASKSITGQNADLQLTDAENFIWSFAAINSDVKIKVLPSFQRKVHFTLVKGSRNHAVYELSWERGKEPPFMTSELRQRGYVIKKSKAEQIKADLSATEEAESEK